MSKSPTLEKSKSASGTNPSVASFFFLGGRAKPQRTEFPFLAQCHGTCKKALGRSMSSCCFCWAVRFFLATFLREGAQMLTTPPEKKKRKSHVQETSTHQETFCGVFWDFRSRPKGNPLPLAPHVSHSSRERESHVMLTRKLGEAGKHQCQKGKLG